MGSIVPPVTEIDHVRHYFAHFCPVWCESSLRWEQYSAEEQSCLAYSYNERLKVRRNTDRKLYIVQDFVNFQQYFLGVGAKLVAKDRRLPFFSIPSPRQRNFALEWREVTDVYPQLPCQATLPSYSTGYPIPSGFRNCVLEFEDNSCLLIKESRAIGVRHENTIVSLTHLSKKDLDNCVQYLVYGKSIDTLKVTNQEWIAKVCEDIENRKSGLTESESVHYEEYILNCTIFYNLTINDIKHFIRLRDYTAEDLIDYHRSECGEYAVNVKFGRAETHTKPPYVPKYTSRAQIMAGKSSDLSKTYGVPGYKGAAENDPDYQYPGDPIPPIMSYHTRSVDKNTGRTMIVSTEKTSTSYPSLSVEQPAATQREKVDSISSDSTEFVNYHDEYDSDGESPDRLYGNRTDYVFQVRPASKERPSRHELNKRCQYTHVKRVEGCIKDFGIYTSPNGYDFVIPKEVRVNLHKHPIALPKGLDVETRHFVPDQVFFKKCIDNAAKLKTTINLNKGNPKHDSS